jgi:hypothetical protein
MRQHRKGPLGHGGSIYLIFSCRFVHWDGYEMTGGGQGGASNFDSCSAKIRERAACPMKREGEKNLHAYCFATTRMDPTN